MRSAFARFQVAPEYYGGPREPRNENRPVSLKQIDLLVRAE